MTKILLIGCGNMGHALLSAWQAMPTPPQVSIVDPTEALRDRRYFARVDLVNGKPIWPNYFDISPLWLQEEMDKRGELQRPRPVRRTGQIGGP